MLINVLLQTKQQAPESVSVSIRVARNKVPQVSIMIVVWSGLRSGSGYEINIKDFVNLEKI
jgi:hypothetical protein